MIVKSWEKEIYQVQLDNEKFVLARLKKAYKESIQGAKEKVAYLATKKQTQSVIYQKQYQEALVKQLEDVYSKFSKNASSDIDEYLKDCYEDGFLTTMYGLHKQGIPLIFPIQQEEATQMAARTGDGVKLSDKLYENTGKTARAARDVITRGFANGASFAQIAKNLEKVSETTFNQAYRIARTEGHRVQNEVAFKTLRQAKDSGADVVKQWDSTLDGRTRPHHAQLDGQIREIDEPFEVAGRSVQYPGGFGVAAEDINCRCAVLQRAKWALDEDELQTLKDRAEFFGLDKKDDFKAFKKKYLKIKKKDLDAVKDVLLKPVVSQDENYKFLTEGLQTNKVNYNPVKPAPKAYTEDEIIDRLAGGDQTRGSCASVGLAYIGQKQGWDVLDFRDGSSRNIFSNGLNLNRLAKAKGVKTLRGKGASAITVGKSLLRQCEVGKEYYLVSGRHAAIVRKLEDGTLQYLEMQSGMKNGWMNFNGNPGYTLKTRFGCRQSSDYGMSANYDFMIDINDSDFNNDDFKSLLGFINTAENEQRKGLGGSIK